MRYATLFRRAWKVTLRSKRLLYFLFLPAMAQVAMYAARVAWQGYRYSAEFGVIEEEYMLSSFVDLFQVVQGKNLAPWLIAFFVLVLLIEYLLMPLVEGTMYLSIRQRFDQPGSYVSLRQKLLEASKSFFQLFELNALIRFFQLGAASIWIVAIYRYTYGGMWAIMRPIILIYLVISIFVSFFSVYAPFFVLFEGSGFRKALKQSFSLAFLFTRQTLTLIFMMFLLSFRIILNVLLLFLVPLVLVVLLGKIGIIVGWVFGFLIGIVVLGLVAYLNALLDIFVGAVWVRAFMALREKQKKLMNES